MKQMNKRNVTMNIVKRIVAATAVTCVLAIANVGAVQAGDTSRVGSQMKHLQAISFDVGRKHVLSYFLSKNGLCDLTVLVTDRPDEAFSGDEIPALNTARFKATIGGGKSAHVDTVEGNSLEYACGTDAQAMSVRQVNQVAVASSLGAN
jgi:hypothetical protein